MREKEIVFTFAESVKRRRSNYTEVIRYIQARSLLLKGMPIYIRFKLNYGERPVGIGRVLGITGSMLLVDNNPIPDSRAVRFNMTPDRTRTITWQCKEFQVGPHPNIAELLNSEDDIYELFYYKDEMNNSACKGALQKEPVE